MHSSAVHNASSVDSLTWVGCLVSSAVTDAYDSVNPARSVNSRRSCAPVHTSRCAAAVRSFQVILTGCLPPSDSAVIVTLTARR